MRLLLPLNDLVKRNNLLIKNISFVGVEDTREILVQNSNKICNFIIVLNQNGNELDVLKLQNLAQLDYIYTAIYPSNLNHMDAYLKRFGFYRSETMMTADKYGEAFYLKF